jgi:hypothetical protein
MSKTQIFLSLFLFFALTRVILRFKEGVLTVGNFLFWFLSFFIAIVIVINPGISSIIAQTAGIGRGSDIVIYISITLIFYLIFRLYIYLEDLRSDITQIVSKLALKDKKNGKKYKKSAKN